MIIDIVTKIFRVLWVPEYRSALLRTGVFASTEHDDIIDGLGLDTVVDIGANRGQFALLNHCKIRQKNTFGFSGMTRTRD